MNICRSNYAKHIISQIMLMKHINLHIYYSFFYRINVFVIHRRTPAIDKDILSTMKMKGTVGYAPNPNNRKRNQVMCYLFVA